MSKAEKFIQNYTRNCSNECWDAEGNYIPWLSVDEARKAVEIAKGEVMDKLRKWVASKNERDSFTFGYIDRHFDELLKQAMKDE